MAVSSGGDACAQMHAVGLAGAYPEDAMEAGEAFTPDGERPQRFNRGPAWLVVVLQLVVEYIATGFFSSMYYGFLPSAVALMRLIRGGHRMKYISAASLDAGEHGTALCDCG